MQRVLIAAFFATCASVAVAQDRANTILVMDGSGSMWGQIDGVNKIVIARDVVGDLIDSFPSDQNLGLTVYGHRERGNCADIETVVAPGRDTGPQIRQAVNGINPRGKTPMTGAIIAAAEALRYTEERATVILVSDGIETCNPDPCAAARALEQAGIDFTAHVIGFDVTDPEALAQMQCLANETGGQFATASNASELTKALTTVAVFPEPTPEPTQITFHARIGTENGPEIDTPVFWDITSDAGSTVVDDEMANPLPATLEQGSHTVTAYWSAQEITSQPRQFMVTEHPREIIVVFDPPAITASIGAPATAVVGSGIEVMWNGPANADDFIGIGKIGATGSWRWRNYTPVSDGAPLQLLVPPEPGQYVIGYFDVATNDMLGSAGIEVFAADISVSAPGEVSVSEVFELGFSGPNYPGDFIGIGKVGASGSDQWKNFTYTAEGSPMRLQAPSSPGDYVIKYFFDQENWPAVEVAITVTEPQISLTAPREAEVSQAIEVAWTGPNTPGDFIGIGKVGTSGSAQWRNFTYTAEGSPLQLMTPSEPGDYVIKYFLDQNNTPLFEVPISVTPAAVTLQVPAVATGGATIDIPWTGPNHPGDFIGIGLAGTSGSAQWRSYAYTADGAPARLRVPTLGGDYEVKYFLDQRNTPVLAMPISVTMPVATLDAPATGAAGATIAVAWTGPNYDGDYIGIGKAGTSGSAQWRSYGATEDGPILTINLPEEPGDYMIKYFVNADRVPIAQRPLTIQ